MPGIFVSYRRVDTEGWAGHLFAELRKSFGVAQVFMDTQGGIPRGADFERVLTSAVEGCDALLALIGPQWIGCKRSDGTRRLDVAGDWVRSEIASALRRDIPVLPVLFGGAALPGEAELPEDLRPLCKRQRALVTAESWDHDVGELIKDLLQQTGLQLLDDVASANTGLRLLKNLMVERPAVADAVSRSQEVIESTDRELDRLMLCKRLHDSLHVIEAECLRPMQAGGPMGRLRPFKLKFAGEARRMQEAFAGKDWNVGLRDDLLDRLESAAAALEAAVDSPGEAAFGAAVGELDGLLSGLSPRLDVGITEAATALSLDRLVDLMTGVRDSLPAPQAGSTARDPELAPFVQGIDALCRLKAELGQRVAEHGQLQRLDSKLRAVCVGGALPGRLADEWARIARVRSRLVPPFSPELAAMNDDLVDIEREIATSLGQEDGTAAAQDLLGEYFRAVSSVFQDVDSSLKEFCLRLTAVGQSLKTVLSML